MKTDSVRSRRTARPAAAVYPMRTHQAWTLLLSQAATAAGFCDQSHLSRSFRRLLGTSPGRYVRGRP